MSLSFQTVQHPILPWRVEIPACFGFLFHPHRYKGAYGGRDAAKSWSFAKTLLIMAANRKLRVLCTRELQASIAESVYKVLTDQISEMGLEPYYEIQKNIIRSTCGSEFIFKGLRSNSTEIKSTEGVDICWVEEAQMVSNESWQVLIPTIRKADSEIWISFNTGEADDPTYQRFVVNPPPDSCIRKVNWYDNPFHSEVMERERQYLLRVDPEAHDHVWMGNPLHISDACIFKGKFTTDIFEAPADAPLFYGADFGFSQDPASLIRSFIQDRKLFIEYEAYGAGVELDDYPEFYDSIPGSREWPILGDNSRPETIAYLKKKGSISHRPTSGTEASRTALRLCENLSRLLSMNAAGTPRPSSNTIPGRRISKPGKSCPSSSTPSTTALMLSDIPFPTPSRPGYTPVLRDAWIDGAQRAESRG